MDGGTMADRIIGIVNECLDGAEITMEQAGENLTELGLSSISFIQMVVALEDEFECIIPDDMLYVDEMNTLEKILDVVGTTAGISGGD